MLRKHSTTELHNQLIKCDIVTPRKNAIHSGKTEGNDASVTQGLAYAKAMPTDQKQKQMLMNFPVTCTLETKFLSIHV
jgi:hypothetical protein